MMTIPLVVDITEIMLALKKKKCVTVHIYTFCRKKMEINKKTLFNKYEYLFFYLPLADQISWLCMLHSLHRFVRLKVFGEYFIPLGGCGKTMRLEIAKWLHGIISAYLFAETPNWITEWLKLHGLHTVKVNYFRKPEYVL